MKMSVCKMFRFDAAHYLPNYEGKCKNLHGHTWTLEVEVLGNVNPTSGLVIDFVELKSVVNQMIVDKLDHTLLNDTVKNPTCENLLDWIATQLDWESDSDPLEVCRLRLYETPDSFAELKL